MRPRTEVFAAVNRGVGAELLQLDMPMGQFKAMATITMFGPQPVGEIGRRLGISEPAASLLVGKLEERGLATRTRDEQDRRRILVAATPAAEELAGRLREGREELVQDWLAALTDDELAGLLLGFRGLQRVVQEPQVEGGVPCLSRCSTPPPPTPPRPRQPPRQPWGLSLSRRRIIAVMAAVMMAMLLSAVDQTVVGTALPRIIADLNGLQHYAWVGTAYLLASTASMPIWGKLSDAFGRKRFFILGMVLFVIGSALCGQSQSMMELVLFRAFQGLGAGAMLPITQAIIGDIFPPAQRAKWAGLLMSVFAVATIIGPLLGGWITDNTSWRWVFYVNLPVGIAAIIVTAIALPGHLVTHKHRIDYSGAALLVAAAVPLLLGFSWAGNEYPWVSWQIIGLLRLLRRHDRGVRLPRAARRRADHQPAPLREPRVQRLGAGQRPAVGGHVRRHHVPAAVRAGRAGQVGDQLRHHPHAAHDRRHGHQHRRRADPGPDRAATRCWSSSASSRSRSAPGCSPRWAWTPAPPCSPATWCSWASGSVSP